MLQTKHPPIAVESLRGHVRRKCWRKPFTIPVGKLLLKRLLQKL
ncbi:hypothetical protein SFOMI_1302 [Sphingobium fuliginis]|uniref:Uncharacterized protein n=1 Tax=Sphingobium fuliginis (strain ATCC 27551) TaxID=336203 RepID=A0A292Z4H4_SPHSA|nr:hypothetical protein SFOMI_1302 [Sphingobium fuliginis]